MILESSNQAVSRTKSACLWCNLKHHTASGGGVFQSTTTSPSVLDHSHHVRIEVAYSTNPSTPVNGRASNLSPAPLSQTAPKGIPVRDPQNFIHPRIQFDFQIQSVRTSSPRQLPDSLFVLTISQALWYCKSLSQCPPLTILYPLSYSLLWLYPLHV
jgi:hypothetical protein